MNFLRVGNDFGVFRAILDWVLDSELGKELKIGNMSKQFENPANPIKNSTLKLMLIAGSPHLFVCENSDVCSFFLEMEMEKPLKGLQLQEYDKSARGKYT